MAALEPLWGGHQTVIVTPTASKSVNGVKFRSYCRLRVAYNPGHTGTGAKTAGEGRESSSNGRQRLD